MAIHAKKFLNGKGTNFLPVIVSWYAMAENYLGKKMKENWTAPNAVACGTTVRKERKEKMNKAVC